MSRSRKMRSMGALVFLLAVFCTWFILSAESETVITLQEAVHRGLVMLESKGGYLGDKVSFIADGSNTTIYVVVARRGDVILNKNSSDQNLVVTKPLRITIPAGQRVELRGIYVACIDGHKSSPDAGDVLDITYNLSDWISNEAQQLMKLIEIIDQRGLYDSGEAQEAVWNITDNGRADGEARSLLLEAGVDPDETKHFPHLSNPTSDTSVSSFSVSPPEEMETKSSTIFIDSEGNRASEYILTQDAIYIRVEDPDENQNSDDIDVLNGGSLIIKSQESALIVVLSETGVDTGVFIGGPISPSEITPECDEEIEAIYTDPTDPSDVSLDRAKIVCIAYWRMFRYDPQHTGRTLLEGPEGPNELWAFDSGIPIDSSPAVAPDGTIYIGSGNKLYAISSDGAQQWEFEANDQVTSPAIAENGTIYFGASPYLYAVNPDGTEKWRFNTIESWDDVGGVIKSSPTIGSDGTIYIGSGAKVLAINPDGTKRWSFITGGLVQSAPAIGEDGTVYVGSYDMKVYAINPDGSEKWEFQTENWIESSPAIGEDGTIYVTSGLKLYAINPAGSEKWQFLNGDLALSSPALAEDGTIYIGAWDGSLYAIAPDGHDKWQFPTRSGVTSSAVIDGNGTIYVGSHDGNLYAINPDGTKKWEFSTGQAILSSPAIWLHKTLYIGSMDGKLYALGGGR